MSRNGEWMLKRLLIVAHRGPSNVGMRQFIKERLPYFRERNPQVQISFLHNASYGPGSLIGYYVTGRRRRLECNNLTAESIEVQAWRMRNEWGEEAPKVDYHYQERAQKSIQGVWTPYLWLADAPVPSPSQIARLEQREASKREKELQHMRQVMLDLVDSRRKSEEAGEQRLPADSPKLFEKIGSTVERVPVVLRKDVDRLIAEKRAVVIPVPAS
eukprot:TRINITY_DN13294_c0_g1_i1.p1 TRINITY_DN13294_c0_g1~~TRINITY_DN13294_c0_g1_i1.p1  ORF type:complete len:215 (+),score=47.90 TRINITY_DN13294_c0_g1_i1:72-716(+)